MRIPSREHAANHGLVVDVLGAEPGPAGRRPSKRVAKLAGVATGAIVLFAAVAAASILAGNRPTGPDQQRSETPLPISGSSALRPDLLSAELGEGWVDRQSALVPQGAPLAADVPAEAPLVVPPPTQPVGPKPKVDVVRRFFELLPANPAEASRLLSPDLLGGDADDFVASWGRVQAITIESTGLRPDGAVLAVVSMQERSGRWLRVEQVFRLTDTTVPRIVGAEVLSAQRS